MKYRNISIASIAALACAAGMALASPAFACPSINAIGNFVADNDLSASFAISTVTNPNDTATYSFTSTAESPVNGVPGLIEYCIYPIQPPANPTTATATVNGANGAAWNTSFGAMQGFFSFKRPDGNPSNVPFDGTTQTMGNATWSLAASATGAPTNQTILLHINDAADCHALYPNEPPSDTCFVYPKGTTPPPVKLCNGAPACKEVVIDEAPDTTPLTVPGKTLLHLHYTYIIVNQPTNSFNMIFNPPSPSTQDINSGGGKDYFGCEQKPQAPPGQPGAFSPPVFANYQGTGFNLNFAQGSGVCNQSRFFLQAPGTGAITLTPGQSVSFTIDMVTRVNRGGQQEYTSCGLHLLNSGFTVKWFQNNNPGFLYSFSTNITPIFVNVVSGGNLVCP